MDATLRIFPAAASDNTESQSVRGVKWVVEWAIALTAVSVAVIVLLHFGFRLAAERELVQAASAGLREAALPRATDRSVAAAISRQLGERSRLASGVQIGIARNGALARGAIQAAADDRLVVRLTVPNQLAAPAWLLAVSPWTPRGEQTVWVDSSQKQKNANLRW
jgi:hypothetical protein